MNNNARVRSKLDRRYRVFEASGLESFSRVRDQRRKDPLRRIKVGYASREPFNLSLVVERIIIVMVIFQYAPEARRSVNENKVSHSIKTRVLHVLRALVDIKKNLLYSPPEAGS